MGFNLAFKGLNQNCFHCVEYSTWTRRRLCASVVYILQCT